MYIKLSALLIVLQTYPDQVVEISDTDEKDQITVLEISFIRHQVPHSDLVKKLKTLSTNEQ